MDPDPRDRVKRLVEEARAQPAASRAAFLDAACGDDEALRRSVERGLDDTLREGSANGSEGLVTATSGMGLDFEDAAGPPEVELPEGARVGPYRVVSRLGRGGQGAVYLAERADQQYEKRVAVKIVPHGLGSELSHRLFRHERQILAGLDHPNIARLLDAGTTEQGFPYFVLEYVEGEPLDRYCDRRGLTTIERLRLFRTVCEAVQYAHRNLVVHRDLKPRNILVSAEGVPKLLDFGIAKLLQPGAPAARTVTAGGVMTPDYASPEQIRFEPITTASDVYSLGVILYELLARRRPYRVKTLALLDLARAICEEEPPRPSVAAAQPSERGWSSPEEQQAARRLARELRGDLDTIVMTALQKDPPRRFPSVEALSEDLRRYLEGLPVRARPEGSLYRAGKFVRRHKGGVAAAALVFLSLLAGLVATAWQARIADEQRRRAERRFADVRGLANSLLFEIHDAIEDLAGATPARELLVKRGLAYLDDLSREEGGDPALRAELAAAYQKLGDIQGRPGFANLGDRQGALASYQKALALRETIAAAARDGSWRRELATNHERVGDTLRLLGDSAGALASYRRALALRQVAEGLEPDDEAAASELGSSHQRLGDALAATGATREALAEQREALRLFEKAASSPDPARRRVLFIGRIKLGDRLGAAGDTEGALASYREALRIGETLAEADPTNARARRELAVGLDKVGNALNAMGRLAEALAHYRRALAVRESLAAGDTRNAELRRDLAVSHDKIGSVLVNQGEHGYALASYRRALALDEAALRARPQEAQVRLDVSQDRQNVGLALARAGRLAEARREYEEALRVREDLAAADPGDVELRAGLVALRAGLAEIRAGEGGRAATPADRRRLCAEARRWLDRAQEAAAGLSTGTANRWSEPLKQAALAVGRCSP